MTRKRFPGWLAAAAMIIGATGAAQAEVDTVKLSSQYGIGYLQLTIMQHDKLAEKHLAKAGLPNTRVEWTRFGAGAAANDALLSGNLHFAAGGTGPAFILWDKTRGNVDVRGVAALCSMPNLLVTRNPAVKSIRDLSAELGAGGQLGPARGALDGGDGGPALRAKTRTGGSGAALRALGAADRRVFVWLPRVRRIPAFATMMTSTIVAVVTTGHSSQ